jgi:hypothetical protein
VNKARLRELFEGLRGDLRDFYDAKRDELEAQRRMVERTIGIYDEMLGVDDGVISEGDEVTVVTPPVGVHTFVDGRCVSHFQCGATEPESMFHVPERCILFPGHPGPCVPHIGQPDEPPK